MVPDTLTFFIAADQYQADFTSKALLTLPQFGLHSVPCLSPINTCDSAERLMERHIVRCAQRVTDGVALDHSIMQRGLILIAELISAMTRAGFFVPPRSQKGTQNEP